MKRLFMVLIIAVVAVFAITRSHAPPTAVKQSLAVHQDIAGNHYLDYANANVTDGITMQDHTAQYTTMQGLATHPGAASAARLLNGDHEPGPMTKAYLYPYVAECEEGGASAKPAQSRHPLRC